MVPQTSSEEHRRPSGTRTEQTCNCSWGLTCIHLDRLSKNLEFEGATGPQHTCHSNDGLAISFTIVSCQTVVGNLELAASTNGPETGSERRQIQTTRAHALGNLPRVRGWGG
eukprot:2562170-Amphidinium_carterae.2